MSQVNTNAIYDASGGQSAQLYGVSMRYGGTNFVNRIINGDMRIDQRNNGASVAAVSTGNVFPVDRFFTFNSGASRFSTQQNAGGVTPPNGFTNYLGATTTSAYTPTGSDEFVVGQRIEGLNVADLGWGTASAQAVTLSFWVRSSLTGTFGVSVRNHNGSRSYPAPYTINAANTWEYKTITVPGDTSGTWLTTNGTGISVTFGLGVGSTASGTANTWAGSNFPGLTGAVALVATSGATWQITGVQLEAGSVATPFERRPYGTELALCQRYYYRMVSGTSFGRFGASYNGSTTAGQAFVNFAVTMRSSPTALEQTGTAANYAVIHQQTSTVCSAAPTFSSANTFGGVCNFTVASGLVAGHGSQFTSASGVTTAFLGWSAEL